MAKTLLNVDLDSAVADAASPAELLTRLCDAMLSECAEGLDTKREVERVSAMFLAYLHREGLLLLPQKSFLYPWFVVRGEPIHCFGQETIDYWRAIADVSAVAERTSLKENDLLRTLRGLRLTSTFATAQQLSDGLLQAFKDLWPKRNDVGMMVNLAFDTTIAKLGLSANRNEYQLRRPGRFRSTEAGPFGWVRSGVGISSQVLPMDYQPRPELFYWADFFSDALGLITAKDLSLFRGSAQSFLHFLNSLEVVPATIADVRAEIHINNKDTRLPTFRESLVREMPVVGGGQAARTALDRRTRTLSEVASMFAAQIVEQELGIGNPIDMGRVKFKGGPRRSKSVRPPMEVEKLDLIRAFNAKDDFAFSRSIKSHYRNVLKPETGRFGDVWFPAAGIAIDMLLELPFRSHQVRYLDSGEGDALVYDSASKSMIGNPSPLATKDRQQGAICMVRIGEGPGGLRAGSGGRNIPAIHVNTNKTAAHGSDEGWVVPWCPPYLEANLRRMIAWASKYVPVTQPVKARNASYIDEFAAEEVLALIPDTYPMFRDPAREDGQPVSRQILFAYWVALLTAVEIEYNRNRDPRSHVFFTKVMPDGSRQPLYDIHALRVSGITAMIERGMPPDMVQEVVGHASLVMTLYYNKVRASAIYGKLEDYFRKRGMTVDALVGLPFEELADKVFNLRSEADAEGVSMLKARFGERSTSWKVFPHGICPGGDCNSGGIYYKNAHQPVRTGACSICRYRVTGPMFLLGMVTNANTLMYQMRTLGEEIADLTKARYALEDAGKATASIDGSLELARRSFDAAAIEWAAEFEYIQVAAERLNVPDAADDTTGALMTPMDEPAFSARIESLPGFALVQTICEGAELVAGFQTGVREAAFARDEWLNTVMDANGYGPLLLKLPKEVRLAAGNLLGRAFLELVPEGNLEGIRAGTETIDVYPQLRVLCEGAASHIAATGSFDLPGLLASVTDPNEAPVSDGVQRLRSGGSAR